MLRLSKEVELLEVELLTIHIIPFAGIRQNAGCFRKDSASSCLSIRRGFSSFILFYSPPDGYPVCLIKTIVYANSNKLASLLFNNSTVSKGTSMSPLIFSDSTILQKLALNSVME